MTDDESRKKNEEQHNSPYWQKNDPEWSKNLGSPPHDKDIDNNETTVEDIIFGPQESRERSWSTEVNPNGTTIKSIISTVTNEERNKNYLKNKINKAREDKQDEFIIEWYNKLVEAQQHSSTQPHEKEMIEKFIIDNFTANEIIRGSNTIRSITTLATNEEKNESYLKSKFNETREKNQDKLINWYNKLIKAQQHPSTQPQEKKFIGKFIRDNFTKQERMEFALKATPAITKNMFKRARKAIASAGKAVASSIPKLWSSKNKGRE